MDIHSRRNKCRRQLWNAYADEHTYGDTDEYSDGNADGNCNGYADEYADRYSDRYAM